MRRDVMMVTKTTSSLLWHHLHRCKCAWCSFITLCLYLLIIISCFRNLVKMQNLYDVFSTLKKHTFLTQQAYMRILDQLKRHLCFVRAYFINDVNNITTECLDYKSSFVYKNYSDRIPCIGNWPGFLMTKMPYVERELLPHLMINFQIPNKW